MRSLGWPVKRDLEVKGSRPGAPPNNLRTGRLGEQAAAGALLQDVEAAAGKSGNADLRRLALMERLAMALSAGRGQEARRLAGSIREPGTPRDRVQAAVRTAQALAAGGQAGAGLMAWFLATHGQFDWAPLWKALGWKPELDRPCGEAGSEDRCPAELIFLLQPEQAIVVIHADFSSHDVYLRYLRRADGKWRFSGGFEAPLFYYPRRHEVVRSSGGQFLRIARQGMRGTGMSSEVEEWFDMSLPEFKPVLSVVSRGHHIMPGRDEISRDFSARVFPSGKELHVDLQIELFAMEGYSRHQLGALSGGAVFRRASGNVYQSQEANILGYPKTISGEDFERLTDVDEGPGDEEWIRLGLAGLKEIARGEECAAKAWLRRIAARLKATPAVLELRKLLR